MIIVKMDNDKTDNFQITFQGKNVLYFLITKYEYLQVHLEKVVRVLSWKHCSYATIP